MAPGDALAIGAAGRQGTRAALRALAPRCRQRSKACTPGSCHFWEGGRSQSTARLWQDLERALSARRRALRAVRRARKRRARWPKLARRRGAGDSAAALSRRRKRSWRTTPSKSSATLCCSVADVSMNLQSNTTAQARPSEGAGSGRRRGREGGKGRRAMFNLNRQQFFLFHTLY